MVRKWRKLGSENIGNFRIFTLRRVTAESPLTGTAHDFYVMDSADWINVIPLTAEGKVVMIHQYRHGSEEVTLEIPGGTVDAKDGSPEVSARRELLEETGYACESLIQIGEVRPNPAILSNRCYSFLAFGVRKMADQSFDSTEDIAVELVNLQDIPALIRNKRITHAMVVAAFYHFEQYRKRHPDLIGR